MKLILLASVLCAFLVAPSLAFAECTQVTVMGSGGQMKFCMSCCNSAGCQVTCV